MWRCWWSSSAPRRPVSWPLLPERPPRQARTARPWPVGLRSYTSYVKTVSFGALRPCCRNLALVVMIAVCIASGLVRSSEDTSDRRLSPIRYTSVSRIAGRCSLDSCARLKARPRLVTRTLLRTGALAAGVAVAYATFEGLGRLAGSASASRIATGSHYVPAHAIPATIWLFDQVPAHRADDRVQVAGSELTVADLTSRSTTVAARLDCTSGWYTDAEWTAVSLADLLPPEQLAAATSIEIVSLTGYQRRFPADEAGSLWLATGYQGEPLRSAHGAPVRLVAPHRRGFWWVKWVASVELSDTRPWPNRLFPCMRRLRPSTRRFGELSRHGDDIDQGAVAPDGDLYPTADGILHHATLQLGARDK